MKKGDLVRVSESGRRKYNPPLADEIYTIKYTPTEHRLFVDLSYDKWSYYVYFGDIIPLKVNELRTQPVEPSIPMAHTSVGNLYRMAQETTIPTEIYLGGRSAFGWTGVEVTIEGPNGNLIFTTQFVAGSNSVKDRIILTPRFDKRDIVKLVEVMLLG